MKTFTKTLRVAPTGGTVAKDQWQIPFRCVLIFASVSMHGTVGATSSQAVLTRLDYDPAAGSMSLLASDMDVLRFCPSQDSTLDAGSSMCLVYPNPGMIFEAGEKIYFHGIEWGGAGNVDIRMTLIFKDL